LVYGHQRLHPKPLIPSKTAADGHPFMARTEVFGFGVRT